MRRGGWRSSQSAGSEARRRRGRVALLALLAALIGPALSGPPSARAADPVIAAAGDIACDPADDKFNGGQGTSRNCRQFHVSELMLDSSGAPNVDAVLPLGDIQYYCGGPGSWEPSYGMSWGRPPLKAITYPAIGNHEYLTNGGSKPEETTGCTSENAGAAGYFGYFGTNFGTSGDPSRGYYSFNLGTWHIIALNSSCSKAGGCNANSPQGVWLRQDLAAHQTMCTLAYWHIPLFSSGGRASDNYRTFWEALYEANADVVLAGHDHTYERFAPQTPTGQLDLQRGIRQWVVGSGGSNHTSWATTAANSEARDNTVFGVLKLTLRPKSYAWKFEPEARDRGLFADEGVGGCHGSEPDTTPPTAPGDLTATAVGAARVDLAWTESTDDIVVTSYEVLRDGIRIATTGKTSYSDTTAAAATTYAYTVRAIDGAGNASAPSNTASATTAAADRVLTFTPVADAWVEESKPDVNHGTDGKLEADASPVRNALLKFDVSGIGSSQVIGVRLKLALTNGSGGSSTLQVHPTAAGDNAWSETGVTWANAPAADMTRRLASLGPTTAGQTYTLDLGTGFVTADGTYSLRILSGSSDGTHVASREAADGTGPILQVTLPG